jgi:hypothetical protein|tara:strand:+ start:891 stop:1490 length:600 start_codon:yes stop_codon:yes gene_type:complete
MPFWSDDFRNTQLDLKDPKRQFRFKVEITGINADTGGSLVWYAKAVNKPSFEVSKGEHTYLNHKFYYPGGVTWNPVTLTLVDPRDPDMSATLSDIVTQAGYAPPDTPNDLGSMSKARSAAALGTVYIVQLDGDGNEIEKWTLWNSFITKVDYGQLQYEGGEGLVEVTMDLAYDWARLEVLQSKGSNATAGNQGTTFFEG